MRHGKACLLFVLVLAAAALEAGELQAQLAYYDPCWAPDWFKSCTGPKQWVEWVPPWYEDESRQWQYNYDNPQDKPRIGVSGAFVDIWMDNVPVATNYKQVWVEICYRYSGTNPPTFGPAILSWQGEKRVELVERTHDVGPGKPFGWHNIAANQASRFYAYYEVWPQPDWERFSLDWDWNNPPELTRVRMLTQCNPIPEPASLALAGVGLAGIAGLRRRRAL